jgi:hypothetical protein
MMGFSPAGSELSGDSQYVCELLSSRTKTVKQSVPSKTAKKIGMCMRLTALWLLCSLSFGADLEALRHEHRWFDLREALKTQKGSTLDRGAAAAAFQQVREAERLLKTSPDDLWAAWGIWMQTEEIEET